MPLKNGGSQKSTGDKTKGGLKPTKARNKSTATSKASKPKSTMQSTYDSIKYIMDKSIIGRGK
jgi:hypothetical protein